MTTLSPTKFVVCITNDGYETSLQRNKIYAVLDDAEAAGDGDLRIVDDTGEDYLYPAGWFVAIDVPDLVQRSVLQMTG